MISPSILTMSGTLRLPRRLENEDGEASDPTNRGFFVQGGARKALGKPPG